MKVLLKDTDKASLYCEWSSLQDVAKNESIVTLSLVINPKTTIGSWTDFNGSYIGTTALTFNGSIPKISSEKTITTKTMQVAHNADGTKDLVIYWRWGVNSPWGGFENPSGSFKIVLPTIERATSPKINVYEQFCGKVVIISTPRFSSTFKHNLSYIKHDKTIVPIASSVDTSYNWTIPLELCHEMTDTSATIITIKCDTLKGAEVVGSNSVKLTIKVPIDIVPTIGAIQATEGNTENTLGEFIKNKTSLNVFIRCEGAYGSQIQSITTKINNTIYKGDVFKTKLLNVSGEIPITTSVIDSRGRKATKTINVNVLPYLAPYIALFKAERCNSAGVLNDSGDHVKISYSYTITSLNNLNAKKVVIEVEQNGVYTTLKTINEYTQNSSFIASQTFDVNKTYNARITLTDSFSKRETFDIVESEKVVLDILANGKGVAFGKVAEKENSVSMGWELEELNTTEWVNITLENTFKSYDTEQTPVYRCIGRVVEIDGAISPKVAYTSNSSRVRFGSIPIKYAPKRPIYILCQGSQKNTWLLSILANGELTISRYGLTDYATVDTSAWLTFHAVYTI